jgi:hypothetical protein
MAKKIYNAVATVGTYKDRDGEEKKRYVNVGSVFENDKGQLSLKLDSVPVGNEWSGWVSFFEPKERDGQQRQGPGRDVSAQEARRPAQRDNSAVDGPDDADDIPFSPHPAPFQP